METQIFYSIFLVISCFEGIVDGEDDVKGSQALDNFPLIDGHNDLPYNLIVKRKDKINELALDQNLRNDPAFGMEACRTCHTDLDRLKKGKVGGLFWVAYSDCHEANVVETTLDQIDVIKRLIRKYPDQLEYVTTADGILESFQKKKIASMIAVEGGHSMGNRLSILRLYYELGVRYMTLTHTCNIPWADGSLVDYNNTFQNNLTSFGERVILEMNRLGMLVDLSHVSHAVMSRAIEISKAPVIFSHSSAFSIHKHHRNVPDDVLTQIQEKDGIVMVNFYTDFVGRGNVSIHDVIAHINYIADYIGVDHVGIGGDYDGVNSVPVGLEDVSKYPDLFDLLHEMDRSKWSIENLEKLAGKNFIRIFKKAEEVRDELSNIFPDETLISDTLNDGLSY